MCVRGPMAAMTDFRRFRPSPDATKKGRQPATFRQLPSPVDPTVPLLCGLFPRLLPAHLVVQSLDERFEMRRRKATDPDLQQITTAHACLLGYGFHRLRKRRACDCAGQAQRFVGTAERKLKAWHAPSWKQGSVRTRVPGPVSR